MAYQRELGDLEQRYGEGADARSHGESYLNLFQSRFIPGGLYLLDEPEAPLSPKRQLSFLVMLKEMVDQEGQFIIATHSPILMAFPGADILSCDAGRLERIGYDDLEHVYITRGFMENPRLYLRELGIL
jgi:predicted ATPase